MYIYFFDNKNSHENERYSVENRMITWFLKNQIIDWNIEWAILLIYEFQEYCYHKIEIGIVIVVLINQSFLINE